MEMQFDFSGAGGAERQDVQKKLYDRINWNYEGLKDSLTNLMSRYFYLRGKSSVKSIEEIILLPCDENFDNGTKSTIYKLLVDFVHEWKRLPERETFIIKQHLEHSNDMTTISNGRNLIPFFPSEENQYSVEKPILAFATKHMRPQIYDFLSENTELQVFPLLLSGKGGAFDKRRLLLLQAIHEETLEERFSTSSAPGKTQLVEALNPVVLLHQGFNFFVNKYRKLPGERLDVKLDRIENGNYFANHVVRYLEILSESAFSKDMRARVIEGFNEFASDLINPPNKDFMITTIQKDGYPFHNMFISLVDAGGVAYGPRTLHLGNLVGYPSIYDRLVDPVGSMEKVLMGYMSKCRLAQRHFEPHSNPLPSGDAFEEHMLNASIAAAIFGNLKLAAGYRYHKNKASIRPFLDTAERQLDYFGEKGKQFRAFSRVFY